MTLPDLADACRKSGLKVVELDGWLGRGRPASTGSFSPRGVLCHHTGSYDALTDATNDLDYAGWMARDGRADLPAPLCHISLSAEGVVYVCAAGRANHAGTAKASGPMPAGDGNAMYIGIEAMNSGSQGWSAVQYDAYARLCAALCSHYGWPADHVRAHKETSITGKWDPGLLDMNAFRSDIAKLIANPEPEDDMPAYTEWSDKDKKALAADVAKAVLDADAITVPATEDKSYQDSANNGKVRVSSALTRIMARLARIEKSLGDAGK